LVDHLKLRKRNAARLRKALEKEKPHSALMSATRIAYNLCDVVMRNLQAGSEDPLSYNTVFGKKSGLLEEMKTIFGSVPFAKRRERFEFLIAKFLASI